MSETILEALLRGLDLCRQHDRAGEEPPLVILWPDRDRQWEALLPLLRARHPSLLTLGPREPSTQSGPAIWLRCALARSVEVPWAAHQTPVVYLPGVSREQLRAADECPDALAPLVGLQHRGVVWSQANDRDWTVRAFLTSKYGGLELTVAEDRATQEAMLLSLRELGEVEVERLRGRTLDASYFDQLLVPDDVREMLRWLDDPTRYRTQRRPEALQALSAVALSKYRLDLERDGRTVVAERLCAAEGAWRVLWERFADAVTTYPGVCTALAAVDAPAQMDFEAPARYPRVNLAQEERLREALSALAPPACAPTEARRRVLELEGIHGARRSWAWASLRPSAAPLAEALKWLAEVARGTEHPLGGDTPDAMGAAWTGSAWQVDRAALMACATVSLRRADESAVRAALQAMYGPWLNDATTRFQERVRGGGFPGGTEAAARGLTVLPGEVLFFADGLRYDVGRWLVEELERRGLAVASATRWIGMPSVTATAKHAASPVVRELVGSADGDGFAPLVRATGKPVKAETFRDLLNAAGYTVLRDGVKGDPAGRGYMEYGELDHRGHDVQDDLPAQIEGQVVALADQIVALLDAGWRGVRVVTDHGWLFLPGGLPRATLPTHVSADKWGRCAVVKPGAADAAGLPTVAWHWNPAVTIVSAPGASVFYACSYSHGGLSLHECLTPDLMVTRGTTSQSVPEGVAIVWKELRCTVTVTAGFEGVRLDVRRKANEPKSTVVNAVKAFDATGRASVLVNNHDLLHEAVNVVLLSSDGTVLRHELQTVGGIAKP
jgi:hypothetical protein